MKITIISRKQADNTMAQPKNDKQNIVKTQLYTIASTQRVWSQVLEKLSGHFSTYDTRRVAHVGTHIGITIIRRPHSRKREHDCGTIIRESH